MLSDVERQARLAHRRPGRHEHEIRLLQTRRQRVQLGEAGADVLIAGTAVFSDEQHMTETIRSLRLAARMGCRHESDFPHVRLGMMQVWRHPAPQDL